MSAVTELGVVGRWETVPDSDSSDCKISSARGSDLGDSEAAGHRIPEMSSTRR